ncbi:hypothetical protein [Anaerococcus sp. Marseille-Q7828]|uniref:hypothetical protein n=1 Tax=Anaerococcus sp. Marseille-Q7828 TaxID=3036300 RepID=UPI0024ACE58B|nr:hypothetical protein [Anaerococcus sp. Marseille-Q7828]
MDIKKASKINLGLGLVGLVILVYDFLTNGRLSIYSIIVFLILFIITLIIEKKFFNCPYCNHHIKRDDFFRKTCRNCGKEID